MVAIFEKSLLLYDYYCFFCFFFTNLHLRCFVVSETDLHLPLCTSTRSNNKTEKKKEASFFFLALLLN